MRKLDPKVARAAANRLTAERSMHHKDSAYNTAIHPIKLSNMRRSATKHPPVNQKRLNKALFNRMSAMSPAIMSRRNFAEQQRFLEEMNDTNEQLQKIYFRISELESGSGSGSRSRSGSRTRKGPRRSSRSGSASRKGSRRSSRSGSASRKGSRKSGSGSSRRKA